MNPMWSWNVNLTIFKVSISVFWVCYFLFAEKIIPCSSFSGHLWIWDAILEFLNHLCRAFVLSTKDEYWFWKRGESNRATTPPPPPPSFPSRQRSVGWLVGPSSPRFENATLFLLNFPLFFVFPPSSPISTAKIRTFFSAALHLSPLYIRMYYSLHTHASLSALRFWSPYRIARMWKSGTGSTTEFKMLYAGPLLPPPPINGWIMMLNTVWVVQSNLFIGFGVEILLLLLLHERQVGYHVPKDQRIDVFAQLI